MPQLTLYAPDITCDHCVATIQKTVESQAGARFLNGDVEGKRFSVEIEGGAVLDVLASALAEEGYPLGEAVDAPSKTGGHGDGGAATHPAYRVTATDDGAEVNYDCPCGCTAGFAYSRAVADQESESCCCGRTMLVGRAAGERLRSRLEGSGAYEFDVQTVTMPWGQPIEAALATPAEPAH